MIVTTPSRVPPVLIKAKESYQSWHTNLVHVKRIDRYTICARIDDIYLAFLEAVLCASFAPDKFEKLSYITKSISKCDILKFLLLIAWNQKTIATPIYSDLMLRLEEIGRMLGGWRRQLEQKTSSSKK
jgi:hypothetical protein